MVLGLIALTLAQSALTLNAAAPCSTSASSGLTFEVSADCATDTAGPANGTSSPSDSLYTTYYFKPLCNIRPASGTVEPICVLMFHCDPRETPGYLYGLDSAGQWIRLELQCRSNDTPAALTEADVARAFERIPLPRVRLISQPAERTLVNLDTIVYADAEEFERTVSLLGQEIRLAIRPTTFAWTWGDGSTTTTSTPGAPYPAHEITHRFQRTGTVHPHLTVTWTARWRTGSGPWAPVPGSVTTTGPAATLRVLEAVPHLAGADQG